MVKTKNDNTTVRNYYQDGTPIEDISKVKVPDELQIRALEKIYGGNYTKIDNDKKDRMNDKDEKVFSIDPPSKD